MARTKITKAERAIFEEEFWRCWRLFGINDYDVSVERAKLEPHALAEVNTDLVQRRAFVYLAKTRDADYPLTEESLKRAAMHECVHVLLGPMWEVGRSRLITQDELTSAAEGVTRRVASIIRGLEG